MNAGHAAGTDSAGRGPLAGRPRAWAAVAVLAAALALNLAGPATAGTRGAAHRDTARPGAGHRRNSVSPGSRLPAAAPRRATTPGVLRLHPMPVGAVRFGRRHGRLTVHAALFGLTPGSAHGVDLQLPGHGMVRFSPLTANAAGQAHTILSSHYIGRLLPGSRLVIRMGRGPRGVATDPIAVTRRLVGPRHRRYRLRAVEAGQSSRGPLRGHAVIAYNRFPAHADCHRLG